jgi:hypothetical protein
MDCRLRRRSFRGGVPHPAQAAAGEGAGLLQQLARHRAHQPRDRRDGAAADAGLAPSAAAITRLEQTFDWVLWIEEAERKLVWSRAARVPWKQISGELGCDRTTAWRRWQLALTKIAARLNAQ